MAMWVQAKTHLTTHPGKYLVKESLGHFLHIQQSQYTHKSYALPTLTATRLQGSGIEPRLYQSDNKYT